MRRALNQHRVINNYLAGLRPRKINHRKGRNLTHNLVPLRSKGVRFVRLSEMKREITKQHQKMYIKKNIFIRLLDWFKKLFLSLFGK